MAEGLWSLLAEAPLPGQAFRAGFERQEGQNALDAYSKNPSDPNSLAGLMRFDPRLGMQAQRYQDERAAYAEDRRRKTKEQKQAEILLGAKIIRERKPTDDASWQSVRQMAEQFGLDLADVPEHFDPNYIQQVIALADTFDPRKAPELMNVAPGGSIFDPQRRAPIYQAPFKPEYHNVPADNIAIPTGGPQGGGQPQGGFDTIMQNWIAPIEGGYASNDGGSGHPVNYGINQGANPDIDVASLTPEQAKEIYRQRYWGPSGADRLPPQLQAIHFDTAVNMGVGQAQKLLAQAGGDPQRYLQLREQRYRQIGGKNLPVWLERNQKLASFASGGLPAGTVVNPKAPKEPEPKYSLISDQEAAQMGLPPGGKYQRAPSGEIKSVAGTLTDGPTRQQIGLAKQKLGNLSAIEAQLGRVERAMGAVEKDGWTGFIAGRVPGALDAESNVFDKAVRQLAPLIRQLTRVPGEGSMSDYEGRLAEMTLPSRTDTPEGRREALAGMRALVSEIRNGYSEFLGGGASAPQKPATSGGWGKATVVQ